MNAVAVAPAPPAGRDLRAGEPTRARYPDEEGFVERDGVRVFYEVYGEGEPTLVLTGSMVLVYERVWKAAIPYLSRHFRVVTCGNRGNGRSDRPRHRDAYRAREFVGDTLAIMDATATERGVVVGQSLAAQWVLRLLAEQPDRALGAALVAPFFPVTPTPHWMLVRAVGRWPHGIYRGWGKWNPHYGKKDWPGAVDFVARKSASEPHSTRMIEDGVEWGLQTDWRIVDLASRAAAKDTWNPVVQRRLARSVRCPLLVIHGDADRMNPHRDGAALSRLAPRGRLVTVRGGGHAIFGRRPVELNLALREFVDSLSR